MVVGAVAERTDVAVIGSGPGGYVAALRLADAGRDVTIVERRDVGGVCLNVGCIPSKTLIEAANLRHAASRSPVVRLDEYDSVDAGHLRAELDRVTGALRSGVDQLLADAGVTVKRGTARFMRRDRLVIDDGDQVSHLEFDDAVVATGSRPVELAGASVR